MPKAQTRQRYFKQFTGFVIVGAGAFVVHAFIVEGIAKILGPVWAQIIAFPIAVTMTWSLNRRFTFGASKHSMRQEWLRYILANLVGWAVSNAVYFALILHFPFIYQRPAIAVAAGSVAGMFFNFGISKWLVFRHQ
jgi:putative flippase GtrA